ncbi:hypothetical protein TKWG_13375 [Advenella kashmirensis WT001]|uniref:Uncharacterized protein n=1 Tax=Advenella kashmirensis (strain DSM 17095 / LMG 22695 / WT001) TaxID=1036672 RepID=I3UCQ3_ADVKW|nr:hypothetical protein TKWG_13375 [Advenella kashmirensis WT001]
MPIDFRFLFARTHLLLRAALLFRHDHTHIRSKRPHRFGKRGPGVLHKECDGSTMRAAAKAVIKLFGGTNGKGRRFFVVKGAKAE